MGNEVEWKAKCSYKRNLYDFRTCGFTTGDKMYTDFRHTQIITRKLENSE